MDEHYWRAPDDTSRHRHTGYSTGDDNPWSDESSDQRSLVTRDDPYENTDAAAWHTVDWDAAPSSALPALYHEDRDLTEFDDQEQEPDLQRYSRLAQPLPFGFAVTLFIAALALPCLVYLVAVLVAHADWAGGARVAGFTALGIALATAVFANIRLRLGHQARSAMLFTALLIIVLVASGAASALAAGQSLHRAQARAYEQQGQWAAAIHEYILSGETETNAPDVIRDYTTWGEQSLTQRNYPQAAASFTAIVTRYNHTSAATERARHELYTTYTSWLSAGGNGIPYAAAINTFITYRQDPACDSACQTTATQNEALAHYQFGVQLATKASYSAAIQQFETVQAQFPTSAYAQQSHLAAATAYYAEGQQQLTKQCASAVPTFQALAKNYADTPEGKLAHTALTAGQTVTGSLTNFPTKPLPTVYLSKSVNPKNYSFSDNYKTSIDSTTGAFTFKNVAPGAYNLSAARDLAKQVQYVYYRGADGNLYDITVAPLCPVNLGPQPYQ